MNKWLTSKFLLLVSVPEGDQEESRLGYLFNTLMLISTVIVIALTLVFLLMQPLGYANSSLSLTAAAFPLAFIPLSLGCIVAAKRGYIWQSIKVYVWTNFIAISLAAWLFDGIHSPAWVLFIWTITVAGTLLSPSNALWMTGGVTAYFFLLFIFTKTGHYTPPLTFGKAGGDFVNISFLLIMLISTVGFLTYLNMKSLRETMASLQKEITERKSIETHLRESEERYRSVFDNARDAIFTLAPDKTFSSLNPAAEALGGWDRHELLGKEFSPIVTPTDLSKAADVFEKVMRLETVGVFELEVVKKSGERLIGEFAVAPLKQTHPPTLLGICRDVTERKRAEEALQKSEERYRRLFEDSPVSLWEEDFSFVKQRLDDLRQQGVTDFKAFLESHPEVAIECAEHIKILDVNNATLRLYKAKSKSDLMKNLSLVFSEHSYNEFQTELVNIAEGKSEFEWEGKNQTLNGEQSLISLHWSLVPGYEDTLAKVIISVVDVTERKQAEEKLIYASTHDALTGVYNRAYFNEELARLERSRHFPLSIVVVDVDEMKIINDNFGHAAGDAELQRTSQVLSAAFRVEDTIARIGGDEFAVLLPNTQSTIAHQILERVRKTLVTHNNGKDERPLSLSIGVATAKQDDVLTQILKEADDRMYSEKQAKKRNEP